MSAWSRLFRRTPAEIPTPAEAIREATAALRYAAPSVDDALDWLSGPLTPASSTQAAELARLAAAAHTIRAALKEIR